MATTRYVSTTGNDNNSGLSTGNAYRTIKKGLASLQDGDTLKIMGGTYTMAAEGVSTLHLYQKNVTITAYDTTPVWVDGQVTFKPGNPRTTPDAHAPTKKQAGCDVPCQSPCKTGLNVKVNNPAKMEEYDKFLYIHAGADNVTVSNLNFKNSGGEGLFTEAGDTTFSNIHVEWNFGAALRFVGAGAAGGEANYVTARYCNRKGCGASITSRYANNITYNNCTVYANGGEGITCVASSYITFNHCTAYDGNKVLLYLDGSSNCVVDSCLVYSTQASPFNKRPHGIEITAEDYTTKGEDEHVATNNTIKNCIVINCGTNFLIQFGEYSTGSSSWTAMRGLKVFNNTFVDAVPARVGEPAQHNVRIFNRAASQNASNSTCWFVNNLIVQRDSAPAFSSWSVSDNSKWITHSNVWSKNPGANWNYSNDTVDTTNKGGLVGGTSAVNLANPAALNLNNFKIGAGSAAEDTATTAYNATVNVTTDFFNSTRPESDRDVGAHELEGGEASNNLVAGISTSPGATITAGGTVTFSDNTTEAGNATVERWRWEFPGGSADDINAASPVVTYPTAGVYQAYYEVFDDTYDLSSATSVTITVQAGGTSGDSFVVGVVSFDAGDTTIAHGADVTPDAAIIYFSGASADNTASNNAVASIGMYSAQTNEQAMAWTVEYNGGASANLQWHELGAVAYDKANDHSAAVTGIDGTNLTLAWTGSGSTGTGTAVFLSGSGINAATVKMLEFPSGTSDAALNQTISGQYNLAFVTGGVYHGSSGGLSWGFAAADSLTGVGTRMACGANSANRAGVEYAATRNDAVATHPNKSITVVPSFGSSSLTMTRAGGTGDPIKLVVLAVNTTGVEVDIGVGQLPSSDVATDYATSFEDVGGVLLAATATTTVNANQLDVPSLNFFAYDGTVQRGNGFYNTSGSAAVGKSYTDDAMAVYDGTADAATTATMSDDTSEFTLTPTGAAGTYFAYIAMSAATTGVAPQADFYHSGEEGHLPTPLLVGDTISFYDLSQDGSGTIDEWDWDWGDGTAHGTTQNPTHVYSSAGEYQVTLTVTDDDDETDSITRTLSVSANAPTISYTLSAETGEEGDEITVDWSASTWYGTTIDEDNSSVVLWTSDLSQVYAAVGTEVDITVLKRGTYNIGWVVLADNAATGRINYPGFEDSYNDAYNDVLTIYPVSALSLSSAPRTGRGAAYVGPIEIDFVLTSNRPDITLAEIDWDWGDGDDDADAGVNVSHEYAAVEEITSYDVTIDVTYTDGTTDQLVVADLVTIAPEFVPPIPLATLAAMWNTYQAHLGDLSGATWVRESAPNTNVWKWEASYDWASNITPRLFENGTELTSRASVELCQANPGSYYATNSSGDITIYVHPTDSDNPNQNEESYRWLD